MKHSALILTVTLGLAASSLNAGEMVYSSKQAPAPPITVPSLCDCFDAGSAQFSLYGAGAIFDSGAHDDALGGGLSLGYFFTENIGIEADATWIATDSVLHHFTGSLVLRYPIKPACIAPYILAGGGVLANSQNEGTWHVGGGIDIRLGKSDLCPGIFADARYTWTGGDGDDFTLIRAGLRFNL